MSVIVLVFPLIFPFSLTYGFTSLISISRANKSSNRNNNNCNNDNKNKNSYNGYYYDISTRLYLSASDERGFSEKRINGYNSGRSSYIDVDELIDPEFLEDNDNDFFNSRSGTNDDNYDNDFDVYAFQEYVMAYNCVVEYNIIKKGQCIAVPYVSNMKSDSTYVVYDGPYGICMPAGPIGQFKETLANSLKQPIVEVIVAFAVLINGSLVAVSTLNSMPFQEEIYYAELFVDAVFAVDFFGRWFSSSADIGRHVIKPQFALDAIVVVLPLLFVFIPVQIGELPVPNWLTSPSALINLELLRVLRLNRVLQNMDTFISFERALGIRTPGVREWQLQLARVLLSLFTLVSVSTGMIYTTEYTVNPQITDYFTALYFCLCTLSTVGFGDIVPITWQGKVVVCGSILVGIAVLPAQTAALFEALLARKDDRTSQQQQKQYDSKLYRSSQQRRRNNMNNNNKINGTTNNPQNGQMILETTMKCTNCGTSMHWSAANYCWSCGEKLN